MSALGQRRICTGSLNHFASTSTERRRHLEAKRLGGVEIDNHFEFDRPTDRQIGWLLAFENSPGIDARSAEGISSVISITDLAAIGGKLTKSMNRWNRMARRQRA
jgi:hypothetical protein